MNNRPIRIKDLPLLLERKGDDGKPVTFNCCVFKKDGTAVDYAGVYCSSSFHNGTRNLVLPNGEIRKVRDLFFISVNGREVIV